MIEEIDSHQYVQHYFEKIYKELDYSPETFLRYALEFIEREAGLLTQPASAENMMRLVQDIAQRNGGPSAATSPVTTAAAGGAGGAAAAAAAAAGDARAAAIHATTSEEMKDVSTSSGVDDAAEGPLATKSKNVDGGGDDEKEDEDEEVDDGTYCSAFCFLHMRYYILSPTYPHLTI